MARLFVAVHMPDAVKYEIISVQEQLKQHNIIEGRYSDPLTAHATLAFIGDVPQESVQEIKKTLADVQEYKMMAQLKAIGVFYRDCRVKVIYLFFVCKGLNVLVSRIQEALIPWEKREARDFVPHITLVRVKKIHDMKALHEVLAGITFKTVDFSIETFTLEQSVLMSDGPRYTTLETYFLL